MGKGRARVDGRGSAVRAEGFTIGRGFRVEPRAHG